MATFKVVVRKKRADGFYPVYIRVVHRSRMGYIKTDKLITDKQITKNGEIKDIVVNEYCSREILRYSDMINRKDVSNYSVAELIEFLIHSDEEICFSDYATKFINRMASEGHERNAKNYRLAVNHLERYLGTTRVMFTHLSSSVLTRWINSLSLTNRAKEMYPTCLRQIFKRALIELNDEERGIMCDSIQFDEHERKFTYYGTQLIKRRTRDIRRSMVTTGYIESVPRTRNNPHGLLITGWRTLENKDLDY